MKTIVLAALLGNAFGHATLTRPASRNHLASADGGETVWPWETCPHCLNDGGVGNVQLAQQALTGSLVWPGYPETADVAGRHSVCGGFFVGDERYNDNGVGSPLSEQYVGSNKGAWGQAAPFVTGGVISLEVDVRAHHKGHFEFYVCNKADQEPGADTTVECLNEHRLQRAPDTDDEVSPTDPNHPERYYVPPPCALRGSGEGERMVVRNMRYLLPEELSCEHCVLQFVYVASNSCNPDGYRERTWPDLPEGCPTSDGGSAQWWSETLVDCAEGGYPEEFWNCADIRIDAFGGEGTLPPASAPTREPAPTLPPTVPVDEDEGGSGPLVIVGLTTDPLREDAGTALPVTFEFHDVEGTVLFSTSLGPLPGSGMLYEEYFPDAVLRDSAEESRLDDLEVAFGEVCVEGDPEDDAHDDLFVLRRDIYVWVDDVQYVSSCASPYTKLRVRAGDCERFPMLPVVYDESAAPTSAPPTPEPSDSTPAPGSPSPPTHSPTWRPDGGDQPHCEGEPCENENFCRSKWGYCGEGGLYCNDESTWMPSCTESTPQPTPQPSPTASPPTPSLPTSSPTGRPENPDVSQCAGEPCSNGGFCRSQWGYCGEGSAYCNADSTWVPSCSDGIPESTPQPPSAPTQSPPTASPEPSLPPTYPPSYDNSEIGSMVKSALESNAASFTNNVLLYQTPTNEWEPSSVYRFDDMVVALQKMWTTGIGALRLYMGDGVDGVTKEQAKKYALVNIAAFLAQSMQETIQYNACDENSWDLVGGRYPLSNACGQLGQSYQDYQCSAAEAHMACEVDPEQALVATTNAKWYGAPAPLFCGPKTMYPETGFWDHTIECNKPWADPPETCEVYEGQKAGGFDNSVPHANSNGRTDVEGCCFWGRGVIQTTGVCNFGKLNFYLGERADTEGRDALYPDVNFCKRPDLICDENSGHPELKWIAGLFYWMESVQRYDEGGWNYVEELRSFVDAGMPNAGDDTGFIHGVSGIVNRGCHSPPCGTGALHAGSQRAQNFKKVLQAMQLF